MAAVRDWDVEAGRELKGRGSRHTGQLRMYWPLSFGGSVSCERVARRGLRIWHTGSLHLRIRIGQACMV